MTWKWFSSAHMRVPGASAPSPWRLGAVGIAAFAAACVSTSPLTRPSAPGPIVAFPPAERAAPRFVAAPASSCVPYARQRSGVEIQGDAHTWWTQAATLGYAESPLPVEGAVIAIRIGGSRGHVGYVTKVVSAREILIDHANWHGRGETAVNVPVIDVSEANDWSLVRVFWLDTGEMGARAYPVDGFILPVRAFAAG